MNWMVGHLVGDYLLQNDWMAFHKKDKTWTGEIACHVHVTLWTLSVLLFTGWWEWRHIVLLYVSHYLLDRTYIVQWYVDKINLQKPHFWLYIINDNVLHILSLYLICKYL